MLIFENERSAMPGYLVNGQVTFPNLPVGHTVNVVCAGVKEGKMYACIQELVVEKFMIPGLKFEVVTPGQFKDKLARFGHVGAPLPAKKPGRE
jgi:hypothetical protein